MLVAGGLVTGYLLAFHPASARHAAPLPTRVVSYQTVGLVVADTQPGSPADQLLQLLGPHGTPQFSPLAQTQLAEGSPQWTADLMAGGSYIFIYLPTGQCLSAVGQVSQPKLALRHCDLECRPALAPDAAGRAGAGARLLPVREPQRRILPDAAGRAARPDLQREPRRVLAVAAGGPAHRLLVVVGLAQPNSAGSAPRCTLASSSSDTANKPLTSSAVPPVWPSVGRRHSGLGAQSGQVSFGAWADSDARHDRQIH